MITLLTGLFGAAVPGLQSARWLIYGALFLGLIGAAFMAGSRHATALCKADQVDALLAQQRVTSRRAADNAKLAAAAVETRERVRVVYRTITQEVPKYVEAHPAVRLCGLDVDGLRLWNAANSGTAPAPASERNAPVPAATDGDGRQPGRPAGQPRGGDAGLSRGLLGAAPGADRLAQQQPLGHDL